MKVWTNEGEFIEERVSFNEQDWSFHPERDSKGSSVWYNVKNIMNGYTVLCTTPDQVSDCCGLLGRDNYEIKEAFVYDFT